MRPLLVFAALTAAACGGGAAPAREGVERASAWAPSPMPGRSADPASKRVVVTLQRDGASEVDPAPDVYVPSSPLEVLRPTERVWGGTLAGSASSIGTGPDRVGSGSVAVAAPVDPGVEAKLRARDERFDLDRLAERIETECVSDGVLESGVFRVAVGVRHGYVHEVHTIENASPPNFASCAEPIVFGSTFLGLGDARAILTVVLRPRR